MKKYHYAATAAAALSVMAGACGSPASEDAAEGGNIGSCNAVIENIMTRTSVRRFTGEPVGRDTLETLVRAGMAAPTAVNRQPWEFVVVDSREVLDSLKASHPYSNLATAPAAIIVCGNMEKALEGDGQAYWIQDCSAASENILLAAHGLGLGAVWCGVFPMTDRIEAVSNVFGLPSYIIPLNLIALGHPEGETKPKDKWNPGALHFNTWNSSNTDQQ